jgi:hypothetical protein
MNRRRAHAEVPLQVRFSGRPSEHVRVCMDEGQIPPLRRCLPLTFRKQASQYLLRRFTGQASRAGNVSGNIHANPPTSMKSSDPVFKPFSDVRGSRWTTLGITGVRLPSPPAFARLTPELRLARQLKPTWPKIAFVPFGRRLSAIVRRQTNGGGPSCFAFPSFWPRAAEPSRTGPH